MICVMMLLGVIAIVLLNKRMETGVKPEETSSLLGTGVQRTIIWFLIIYGMVAIRFIGLTEFPGGMNQDGVMGAVDAKALADYGTDRFGTWLPAHFEAWGYGQMSVLLSYVTVPFIKILGLTKWALRLPMFFFSIAGSFAIYGIVKRIFNSKMAMVALLFTAINPWHFMQGRWALDCNLFPHIFVIAVYFLIKGLEKSRNLYISMLFFALCMYCYGVAFYMVPFFLLTICILMLVYKKISWKEIGVCLLVYFGVSWPIYGTMLINFMKWKTVELPFVTMSYFGGSVRSNDMLFFSEKPLEQLRSNFSSLLNVVFFQKEDLLWNAIKEFGTMYKCAMPLIILGAILVIRGAIKEKEKNKKIGYLVLTFFWIYSIFVGLLINNVNINRINIIFYCHIIFAGVGIYFLISNWKKSVYIFIIIFSVQSMLFFQQYFTSWEDKIEKVFYADFIEAVDCVSEYDCDRYWITPDTQYEGAWTVTEMLVMFEFDIDSKYYRGDTNRWNNKEIAYKERFVYGNPAESILVGDTAYVFKIKDRDRFSDEYFLVKMFGDYGAAIPWNIANR